MKNCHIIAFAAALLSLLVTAAAQQRFTAGQAVYIVCMDTAGKRQLSTERIDKERFSKLGRFRVAETIENADVVFLVVVDDDADPLEELALVLLPKDFSPHMADLDKMRSAALWSGSGKARRILPKSVSVGLIDKFHQATANTGPAAPSADKQ